MRQDDKAKDILRSEFVRLCTDLHRGPTGRCKRTEAFMGHRESQRLDCVLGFK